ncbi:MAG: hypothetical protein ACREBS_07570 [Nitrososphaerales archaeon]
MNLIVHWVDNLGISSTNAELHIGMATHTNLTISMRNCKHRRYIPKIIQMVESGTISNLI